jgi:hypothetical protein
MLNFYPIAYACIFLRFPSNIGTKSISESIRILITAEYIVGLPVAWAEQLWGGGVFTHSHFSYFASFCTSLRGIVRSCAQQCGFSKRKNILAK